MATQRIVTLVDMDCFYCQVEARLEPKLKGKPVAVVQYNQWKGGGIIAVNYEARKEGVTRYMRGSEAKQKCPDIVLVSVPTIRGKADLTKYREAGEEVAEVFCQFSDCVQRASVDEAYIDITKVVNDRIQNGLRSVQLEALASTFVIGFNNANSNDLDARKKGLTDWLQAVHAEESMNSADYRLAVGAVIAEEMRAAILDKTGFHCSAGIAHNKILAKLAAGIHKPKCQTILPHDSVPELYENLPVIKVRNLGGKMGKLVSDKLQVTHMSELYKFTLTELQQKIDEKTGSWLYNIARGIDLDPVTSRLIPESIGCCKNFPGKNSLGTRALVQHWVQELAREIAERLARDAEKNKRRAKLMTVSFSVDNPMSRSGPLTSYQAPGIAQDALNLLAKFNTAPPTCDLWSPPIKYMGISVGKFMEEQTTIGKFLQIKSSHAAKKKEETRDNSSQYFQLDCANGQSTRDSGVQDKRREVDSEQINKKSEGGESCSSEVQNDDTNASSFFLSFIKKRREAAKAAETEELSKGEDTETIEELSGTTRNEITEGAEKKVGVEDENWISLSEVIPDVTKADHHVVDMLPKSLRDKFIERCRDAPGPSRTLPVELLEVCSECKKHVPLEEFPEHCDYHAAVKLHAEINASTTTSHSPRSPIKPVKGTAKRKKGEKQTQRKEKRVKSITAFFSVIPKEEV